MIPGSCWFSRSAAVRRTTFREMKPPVGSRLSNEPSHPSTPSAICLIRQTRSSGFRTTAVDIVMRDGRLHQPYNRSLTKSGLLRTIKVNHPLHSINSTGIFLRTIRLSCSAFSEQPLLPPSNAVITRFGSKSQSRPTVASGSAACVLGLGGYVSNECQ